MMKALSPLWTERTPREQALIAVASVIALGVFAYLAVARPLAAYHGQAERGYRDAMTLLEDVRADAAILAAARMRADERAAPSGPARAIAGAVATELGIGVTRIQPGDDGSLTIWIDAVSPTLLFRWLVDLERDHGFAVDKAFVTKNEGSASVRAQVEFAGGSS